MSDYGTTPPPPPPAPAANYALWPKRVLGYLIDVAVMIPAYIVIVIGAAIGGGFGALVVIVGYLAIIGIFVWNICLKQGSTGQTIGKGVIGIKLIDEQTGQPIGAGMAFVRQIAHILDGFCFVGYLWPLWDEKRQTFADKILKTIVVEV
jgi:uncharacterized RDD family membrane protein YckC